MSDWRGGIGPARGVVAGISLVACVVEGTAAAAVLYDNGPLVNSPGTGVGGADESVLQNNTLGMGTNGLGHQLRLYRMADDFTVPVGHWLRAELRGEFEARVFAAGPIDEWLQRPVVESLWKQHQQGRDYGLWLWSLLIFAWWLDSHCRSPHVA